MIDKEEKKHKKLHILDSLAIIIIIGIIGMVIFKFSGESIGLKGKEVYKQMEYTVTTFPYEKEFFNNLKVGTVLAEDKKMMPATITHIEIIDEIVTMVDNNGKEVRGPHPLLKKAVITIEAEVLYKNPVYRMGKQELREGLAYFIITEQNNLSGMITEMKVE